MGNRGGAYASIGDQGGAAKEVEMAFDARALTIFIASPGDTRRERDAIEDALHDWNAANGNKEKIVLVPWRWELDAVPELGGSAQSVVNRQALDGCDVVIAVFNSYLGSAVEGAVSGTAHEILRAHEAGKPVHVYFSKKGLPRNIKPEELARLNDFRTELSDKGLLGQYNNLDDLKDRIIRAIEHDVAKIPRTTKAADTDRGASPCVLELIEVHHRYKISSDRAEYLDMEYNAHRVVRTDHPGGYPREELVWTKPSDRLPPFDPSNPPRMALVSCRRSAPGSAAFDPPRKCAGSSFAIDLMMDPPLRVGETIDFSMEGFFPKYRYADATKLREATRGTGIGERDFDYIAWPIDNPTKLLKITIDLPRDEGIEILGPRSSYHNYDFPITAGPVADLNEEYSCNELVESGVSYNRMQLTVKNAKRDCRYRLAWRLP